MAVYDDERPDAPLVPDDDEPRKLTDVGAAEEKAIDERAATGGLGDIANHEKQADDAAKKSDAGSGGGGSAAGIAGAAVTGGAAGVAQKLGKVFLGSRKRKAATGGGALAALLATAAFGGFLIVSGPLQFVHAAELLTGFHFSAQSNFSDKRSAKFLYYALSGKTAQGRLGLIDNKIANKMELKLNKDAGLESVYSKGTQRLIGYRILDKDKAASFLKDMAKDGIPRVSSLRGVTIDGKDVAAAGDFVDFSASKFSTRRSVTRTAVRATGVNKAVGAITTRLLKKRAGVDFHPLKNIVRKKADSYAKYRDERKQDQVKDEETGTGGGDVADPEVKAKRTEISDKLKSFIKTIKGPLLAVSTVCAVKGFSSSIDSQNLENQEKLIRMGMDTITLGNQIKSGKDFNSEQLGVYNEDFYDPVTKTSWLQDPGIEQESGQSPISKDYASDAKPGKQKPLIFDVIDRIPTGFGGFDACSLLTKATNIPGVKQALNLFQDATNAAFHAVGLKSPDEYAQMAAKYFASGAVDVLARGAERGGLINIGARLAANNQFQAMGGRALTAAETTQVKQTAFVDQQQDLADASTYDKYFNVHIGTSVLSSAILGAPHSFSQFASDIGNLPGSLSNLAMSVMGMRTAQAATTYDYGFPLYGFSEAEQDDPQYADPFANENYMLEGTRLDDMNQAYGNDCFGMQVDKDGNLNYGPAKDMNKIPDKCNDTNNEELTHYRFYLADMVNAHGMACYEGEEDSCAQINGGAAQPVAPTTPTTGAIIIGDTSDLTCAVGTDSGIGDGYANGTLYKTRLCTVQGTLLSAQIAVAVDNMLKAANAAGVGLQGGSGFRTMAEQTYLYNCYQTGNCNNGNLAAKPGYSNHQMGLAVDFHCNGPTITSGDECFKWLQANAATYGLKNLPAEAWHWSYDGS